MSTKYIIFHQTGVAKYKDQEALGIPWQVQNSAIYCACYSTLTVVSDHNHALMHLLRIQLK